MPELPEVETVCKTLYPLLVHHKIIDVKVFMNKVIKTSNPQTFINQIIGQTINDIQRVGKLIIFVLDDYVLLSHLRMEGKYYYQKKDTPTNWKHILLKLEFENNYQLCYHDTRQFGAFHLQPINTYQTLKPYTNIGLEPFNTNITAQYLQNKWKNKKQNIKSSLLDQRVMSGLGNIYVNEVLFYANIHPESITNHLTLVHLQTIIDKSIMVLTKAIKLGGSTINSYTSSLGVKGYYQNSLQVHTRQNQPCFVCTTRILKTKVSARGTYFCPHCQIKY